MAIGRNFIADQWEDIKPTFLRLYHDENKSLDEVRRELAENHHFKASRSAFTRQIGKWGAFKNYKASDIQLLASQRIEGQQPKVDLHGRPIKWDRVYRATRGPRTRKSSQRSCVNDPGFADSRRMLASAARPLLQPSDLDSRVISSVVSIWRHSTVQFASRHPSAPSYHIDYTMYSCLMQSMVIITTCSKLQWPKLEIDTVCDAMPALVKAQPAMVCDLLGFLTTRGPSQSFRVLDTLRDQLFNYIRNLSRGILPEANPFRRFTSNLDNREALTRLGAAIAKAKVDTMWNTFVGQAGQTQHDCPDRPFFRHVLINALLVVMDYEELEFVSLFLEKLSAYDPKDPFYLAACARLLDQQGKHEEAMGNRDAALTLVDTLEASNSAQIRT